MGKKITVAGKKQLEEKIAELNREMVKLREEKALAYTATGDTWHDNPYFNKLEADERNLEVQIAEVQKVIDTAEIIIVDEKTMKRVGIGSIIKCSCYYIDDDEIDEMTFEIVGFGENDLRHGKIHYESLVAKNLLGLRLNEEITFETPAGEARYKILKFYEDWDAAKKDA